MWGKVDRSDLSKIWTLMVDTKKLNLEVEIEVDVPLDIIEDKKRIKAVEDGLGQTISKGLYEQGVSFKVKKITSKVEWYEK